MRENLRKGVKKTKNCKKKSDSKIRVSARHSQGRRQGHYCLFRFIKEIKKAENKVRGDIYRTVDFFFLGA